LNLIAEAPVEIYLNLISPAVGPAPDKAWDLGILTLIASAVALIPKSSSAVWNLALHSLAQLFLF